MHRYCGILDNTVVGNLYIWNFRSNDNLPQVVECRVDNWLFYQGENNPFIGFVSEKQTIIRYVIKACCFEIAFLSIVYYIQDSFVGRYKSM